MLDLLIGLVWGEAERPKKGDDQLYGFWDKLAQRVRLTQISNVNCQYQCSISMREKWVSKERYILWWSRRPNPEDWINRKPDDWKNIGPKKEKNLRPNSTVLYLIFSPIYI